MVPCSKLCISFLHQTFQPKKNMMLSTSVMCICPIITHIIPMDLFKGDKENFNFEPKYQCYPSGLHSFAPAEHMTMYTKCMLGAASDLILIIVHQHKNSLKLSKIVNKWSPSPTALSIKTVLDRMKIIN